MKLLLKRFFYNKNKTLGNLFLLKDDKLLCMVKTLELPWRENKRKISCIPSGEYRVLVHQSPRFGWSLWLRDVPERSEILIHRGNYTTDTLGCILPGLMHDDINNDGVQDVVYSRIAMEVLEHYIKQHGIKELFITVRYDNEDYSMI